VQVLSHSINKELVAQIVRLNLLSIGNDGSEVVLDSIFIFGEHQIWNFTSVEHVVDVFEE